MDKLKLIEAILGADCCEVDSSESAFRFGEKIFIRTVTHYLTGRFVEERGGFLFLDDAAWIADTGRFSDALKTGKLNEVEPCPGRIRVNRECIVDINEWSHDLPRIQQ